MLWDFAISYCRERHLGWETKISRETMIPPLDSNVSLLYAKEADFLCPLGTNHYPLFTLREGPQCPNSEAHNKTKAVLRFNAKYFDKKGSDLTNVQW